MWKFKVAEYRPDLEAKPNEQLREQIIAAIKSGVVQPGDELPGVHELSEQFQTSITPVRGALDALAKEGWIDIRVGKSPVVAKPWSPEPVPANALTAQWEDEESPSILCDVLEAGPREAQQLRCDEGALVAKWSSVDFVDDEPSRLRTVLILLPEDVDPDEVGNELTGDPMVDSRTLGVAPVKPKDTIGARSAFASERQQLGLSKRVSVLVVDRIVPDASGQVLARATTILPGVRYSIEYPSVRV